MKLTNRDLTDIFETPSTEDVSNYTSKCNIHSVWCAKDICPKGTKFMPDFQCDEKIQFNITEQTLSFRKTDTIPDLIDNVETPCLQAC